MLDRYLQGFSTQRNLRPAEVERVRGIHGCAMFAIVAAMVFASFVLGIRIGAREEIRDEMRKLEGRMEHLYNESAMRESAILLELKKMGMERKGAEMH